MPLAAASRDARGRRSPRPASATTTPRLAVPRPCSPAITRTRWPRPAPSRALALTMAVRTLPRWPPPARARGAPFNPRIRRCSSTQPRGAPCPAAPSSCATSPPHPCPPAARRPAAHRQRCWPLRHAPHRPRHAAAACSPPPRATPAALGRPRQSRSRPASPQPWACVRTNGCWAPVAPVPANTGAR
ncbi:hypothetical protein ACQJBY_027332 [Aegilops geniculata]